MTAPALSVPVDVAVPDSHLDLLTRPVVGVLTASACDRAAQLRPGEAVRLVRAPGS